MNASAADVQVAHRVAKMPSEEELGVDMAAISLQGRRPWSPARRLSGGGKSESGGAAHGTSTSTISTLMQPGLNAVHVPAEPELTSTIEVGATPAAVVQHVVQHVPQSDTSNNTCYTHTLTHVEGRRQRNYANFDDNKTQK